MNTVRVVLAGLAAGTVLLPSTGALAAAPDPGPSFGQHVSECARTTGLSAIHNPGMHQGKSGWQGMSCTTSMP